VLVRDATASDLEPIRSLYNALLLTTTIAWSETPQTAAEREASFARQTASGFPVLVSADAARGSAGAERHGVQGESR